MFLVCAEALIDLKPSEVAVDLLRDRALLPVSASTPRPQKTTLCPTTGNRSKSRWRYDG